MAGLEDEEFGVAELVLPAADVVGEDGDDAVGENDTEDVDAFAVESKFRPQLLPVRALDVQI